MRILFYYSKPDSYQEAVISLKLRGHEVSVLWADIFKETHMDRCDEVYINHDVEQKTKDRITKHYGEKLSRPVYHVDIDGDSEGSEPDGSDGSDVSEAAEAAEMQAQLEREEAADAKAKADKEAADLAAKAEVEKREAEAAEARAKLEREEADDAKAKADAAAQKAADLESKDSDEDSSDDDETQTYGPNFKPKNVAEYKAALDANLVDYPENAVKADLKKIWDALNWELDDNE